MATTEAGGEPSVRERGGTFRPLRHRAFRLVFFAGLISTIGTWMQTVAVGALVTSVTGKAAWAGLAAAATFLPVGVLSPVGGALADRVDRKRFLVVSNLVDAALALFLTFLAATGRASPAAVTGVVFLEGCVAALRIPFYQAILPELVPKEDLLPAISLNSANYNLGRVVGPSLAGVVIAWAGFTAAFAVNAASFLALIAALQLVQLSPPVARQARSLLADIRDGARAAVRERPCLAAILTIAVVALLASPFIALVPAVAERLVERSPGMSAREVGQRVAALTGALTASQGVGAVVGALALTPLAERFGRGRMLRVNLALVCLLLPIYAIAPSPVAACALLLLVGGAYIGVLSGLSAVVQLRAPAEYRGRILSLYLLALGALYPIGALVQGPLADVVGLPVVTTGGAVALAAVLLATRALKPGLLRALDVDRDD